MRKYLYVSVGITRHVLMFRKASNIHFYFKRSYKIVALRQVEIPFCGAFGRKRGRGFGALAQVVGRTANPFLRKLIFPAAKRVGADSLEFAAQKIAEVVIGGINFKTAAKSVPRQTLRKPWVVVARKTLRAESFQQFLKNISVACEASFLQTLLINHVQ